MADLDLLLMGCAVSFIAAAGAYLYVRERFEDRFPKDHAGTEEKEAEEDQRAA